MFIMYRGYELVPVKVGEGWKVPIHSGGKPVAATMLIATEESALAEAKKIADDFRAGWQFGTRSRSITWNIDTRSSK